MNIDVKGIDDFFKCNSEAKYITEKDIELIYNYKEEKFKNIYNILEFDKKYGYYKPYWMAFLLNMEDEIDIDFDEKIIMGLVYKDHNILFVDTLKSVSLIDLYSNAVLLCRNGIKLPKINFNEIKLKNDYKMYKDANERMKKLWLNYVTQK